MKGANSCLSILPTDVLKGRCEPVVGGEGAMGRALKPTLGAWNVIVAVVDLVFLQGFTPIQETEKWGRPLPAACACAVTSQSYSVHPVIPTSFSSPAQHYPLLWNASPMHGTILLLLFVLLYFVWSNVVLWVLTTFFMFPFYLIFYSHLINPFALLLIVQYVLIFLKYKL